jgi:hypothetical protein
LAQASRQQLREGERREREERRWLGRGLARSSTSHNALAARDGHTPRRLSLARSLRAPPASCLFGQCNKKLAGGNVGGWSEGPRRAEDDGERQSEAECAHARRRASSSSAHQPRDARPRRAAGKGTPSCASTANFLGCSKLISRRNGRNGTAVFRWHTAQRARGTRRGTRGTATKKYSCRHDSRAPRALEHSAHLSALSTLSRHSLHTLQVLQVLQVTSLVSTPAERTLSPFSIRRRTCVTARTRDDCRRVSLASSRETIVR